MKYRRGRGEKKRGVGVEVELWSCLGEGADDGSTWWCEGEKRKRGEAERSRVLEMMLSHTSGEY